MRTTNRMNRKWLCCLALQAMVAPGLGGCAGGMDEGMAQGGSHATLDAPQRPVEENANEDGAQGFGNPGRTGDGLATVDEEAPNAEEIEKGKIDSCINKKCEIFQWKKGWGDQWMKPVSSHICSLTRISGDFDGESHVEVHSMTTDPGDHGHTNPRYGSWWKLGGFQYDSSSLLGDAVCVPKSNFKTDSGGVVWGSKEAWVSIWGKGSYTVPMWQHDAASYLNGIAGDLDNSGSMAWVKQGNRPRDRNWLHAKNSDSSDRLMAFGNSTFAGVPGSGHHMFEVAWAMDGYVTNEINKSRRSGRSAFRLVHSDVGVCHFTRLGGDFDGANERARIYLDSQNYWTMEIKAGTARRVYAATRCMYYDQRNILVHPI